MSDSSQEVTTRVEVAKAASDHAVAIVNRWQRIRTTIVAVGMCLLLSVGSYSVLLDRQQGQHLLNTQSANTNRAKTEQKVLGDIKVVTQLINEAAGPKAQAASKAELAAGLACILDRIDFDLHVPGAVSNPGCG